MYALRGEEYVKLYERILNPTSGFNSPRLAAFRFESFFDTPSACGGFKLNRQPCCSDLVGTSELSPKISESGRSKVRLLHLCFAVGLMVYLFHKVPIAQVLSAIKLASLTLLLASFLTTFMGHFPVAKRLKYLADSENLGLSTFEIFQINLATIFYGLFLPGGNFTGVAVRFYKMSSSQKKYVGTIVALFLDRLFAMIVLCLIGVVFWLLECPIEGKLVFGVMTITLAVLLIFYISVFARWPPSIQLGRILVHRFPKKLQGIQRIISRLRLQPQKVLTPVFALSILAHMAGVLSYYLIAKSLSLEISFVTIAWVRSATILVAILPVSVSGLGVRESALLLLLAPYGTAPADALAFSLLVFATTILGTALVGGTVEAKRLLL